MAESVHSATMSRPEKTIYVKCNPSTFGGMTEFPVTIPRQKIFIAPASKVGKPWTIGREVDDLVKEWYAARNLPVPPEQLVGAQLDAVEAQEGERLEQAVVAAEGELPSVVPEFGTPEFWAYHRAKKVTENKRRAEAGLPPLPTKKELEAEKAKRKAEREAKKAQKLKAE